jgi:AraC-like DNA-binding protein
LAFRRGVLCNGSHYDSLQSGIRADANPITIPLMAPVTLQTSTADAHIPPAAVEMASSGSTPLQGLLSPAVPLSMARLVAHVVELRGISKAELLQQAGLPAGLLDRDLGEVYGTEFASLCMTALRLTRDPCLGIELGLNLPPTMLGTLGHALLTAGSLTDAVELAVTYWRLNARYFEVALHRSDRDLRVRATERMPLGPLRRFALESMLTAWIHAGRHLTSGVPSVPQGLLLRFNLPYDPAFERYAARMPSVHYGCDVDELVLPLDHLATRLPMGHPEAARQARAACDVALNRLTEQSGNFVQQVADALALTTEGYPTMAQVAQRMGITARTLARHLDRHGLTFRQVLDERRHHEACSMLRESRQPVEDIAARLGYSDPANFTRAFRRWAGCTPTQFREQAFNEAAAA